MQFTTSRGARRARTLAALMLATALGCGSSEPTTSGTGNVNAPDKNEGNDEGDAGAGGGNNKKDASKGDNIGKRDGGGTQLPADDGTNQCASIRQEAAPASGGVDVVFLIDTSGSMLHAITQVQQNMANFVQNFEGTSASTRVVVITGRDPAAGSPVAGDADNYLFIESEVDSRKLYEVAINRYDQYADFLRDGSVTMFVMITDDNDDIAPAAFKTQMEQRLGHSFILHSIASESVNGLPCISEAQKWNPLCTSPIPTVCAAIAVGSAYNTLADETGGVQQSICKEDWVPVFEQLRAAVIEAVPLPCNYALSSASNKDFDSEKVKLVYETVGGDSEEFPRATTSDKCTGDAWYYDDNAKPTSIQLCPAACETVAAGGSLSIAFGCPPIFVQ